MKNLLAILAVVAICSTFAFAQSAQQVSVNVTCPTTTVTPSWHPTVASLPAPSPATQIGYINWDVVGDGSTLALGGTVAGPTLVSGTGVTFTNDAVTGGWASSSVVGCARAGTLTVNVNAAVDPNATSGVHNATFTLTLTAGI